MKKKLVALFLTAILLFALLAGCGNNSGSSSGDSSYTGKDNDTIKLYDGTYSELYIRHHIMKLLIEEYTDLKVEIMDEMNSGLRFDELVKGDIDMSASYDGSLLTTHMKLTPEDTPEGMTLYEFVNEKALADHGVYLLGKQGLSNTYCIGVPEAIAEEYNLKTISDLIPVAGELRFGAEHDFFTELGPAKFAPFTKAYGLDFKTVSQLDINLKYAAMEAGELDVMIVYTTDGLNRKAGLKVLEDDLGYFPEYNAAIMVRKDFFEKYKETAPNLEEVMAMTDNLFTDEIMTDMTYLVDVEQKDFKDVARNFLVEKGLLK